VNTILGLRLKHKLQKELIKRSLNKFFIEKGYDRNFEMPLYPPLVYDISIKIPHLFNRCEVIPTVEETELSNVAKISNLTRVEADAENPRISSGISTRTSVEIAGLLFDGFSLLESADITIYPQYDAGGGVDSERTFVKQIVQKFISDGANDELFTEHDIDEADKVS